MWIKCFCLHKFSMYRLHWCLLKHFLSCFLLLSRLFWNKLTCMVNAESLIKVLSFIIPLRYGKMFQGWVFHAFVSMRKNLDSDALLTDSTYVTLPSVVLKYISKLRKRLLCHTKTFVLETYILWIVNFN